MTDKLKHEGRKRRRKKREVIFRKIAGKRPFQRWRSRPFGNNNFSLADEKLWRIVDGAVADALNHHPDYLSEKGSVGNTARRSIVKRVVGAVRASQERGADRVPTSAADRQEG